MFHEFIDVSCRITTFLKSSVSPEDEYYLFKSENAHSPAKVALFLFTVQHEQLMPSFSLLEYTL